MERLEPEGGTASSPFVTARRLLGAPVQIAYAVRDIRDAAKTWCATQGAGPFFVMDHIALHDVRYRGRPGLFDHSSAYGQWGPLMVELVHDHTIGASPIADVVGVGGTGLHHVAHFVPDFTAAQDHLTAIGFPELLCARTTAGNLFAFHDARERLGHLIEIYEPTPALVGFYERVRSAAVDWDGSDPIRGR